MLGVCIIMPLLVIKVYSQSLFAISDNCNTATVQIISADGAGQTAGTTFGTTIQVGETFGCAPITPNQSAWFKFLTPPLVSLVPLIVNVVENPPQGTPCNQNCCPITTVVYESISGNCPMADQCKMVSCQSTENGPQTPFGGGGNPALTRRHRHQLGLNELLPNTWYYVQILYTSGGSCSSRALFNYWVSNAAVYTDITNPTATTTYTSLGPALCNIVATLPPSGATIVSNCTVYGDPPRDTVNTVIRECHPFNTNGNTTINFSNYIGSNCPGLDGNWDTTKNVAWVYWKLLDMSGNVLICGYIGSQTIITISGLTCYTDYILCFQYEIKNCTHATHTFYVYAPNTDCAPLAVELINFDAVYTKEKNVLLAWQTMSEKNNSHFLIERSMDAVNFIVVGHVLGHGNSVAGISYQTHDEYPLSGTSYYRLKQVDFDGHYEYSEIRVVSTDESNVSLYPNPVNSVLFVKTDKKGEFIMTDAIGQVVKSVELNNGTSTIDMSDIPNGIYFINVSDKNFKVLIVH